MDNEPTNLADRVSLRPVEMTADEEFLIDLYYTTRDDIEQAPIDEEQKRSLSLMQYTAQKHHYETHHSNASHDIVLFDGKNIGRLWTARYETEIIVVDIALLPEHRNLGIGTVLMRNLIDEAEQSKRVLHFHVLKMNTNAIRFYERLKCKYIDSEASTHFKMRWRAEDKIIAGE